MGYYEIKTQRRGYSDNEMRPDIEPGSERVSGRKLVEAIDDAAAHGLGLQRQAEIGPDYIVSVSIVRDGKRIVIYP